MAEKNKEIVTLIGRRLREAAESGQASELPDAIRLGLERLDGLDTAIGGSEESGGPLSLSRVRVPRPISPNRLRSFGLARAKPQEGSFAAQGFLRRRSRCVSESG